MPDSLQSPQGSPGPSYLVAFCSLVIALVMGYHLNLEPLEDLLGLAHTKVVRGGENPVMLVDHLSSSDAPVVARILQGEVWGRHRAQGWGILLPMLGLTVAFAGLLSTALPAFDRDPAAPRRKALLPPVGLGLPLFLGACVAAGFLIAPVAALLPWMLCAGALAISAGLGLCERRVLGKLWAALSGARWFWLGFLLLSPGGFFRWDYGLTPGASTGPSGSELLTVAALVAALYGVERWRGVAEPSDCPWASLGSAELWILLPSLGVAMAVGSLRGAMLPSYLLVSLASGLLIVGARSKCSMKLLSLSLAAAILACWLISAQVFGFGQSGPSLGWVRPEMARAQQVLAQEFGRRVRLAEIDGITLLVGCQLDVDRQSEALGLATRYLGEQPSSVSVRSRRWERGARILLSLTVTIFLVVPTFLLTVAPPGRCGRPFRWVCALLAGLNLAFALGATLGWFWLEPLPHLAGFGLMALLAWMARGHARDWVDAWISESVRRRGSLTSPC